MRGKVRNRATAVTQWPAADQSGIPIRTKVEQIIADTPGGGGTGDVVGPASAVDDHLVSFDGVTGKLVQDSGVAVATVVLTSDARLSDARPPTAHHASHENGGSDELTVAGLNGVLADPQPPIIGAGATQAVAGNDARLTDARTPTAHAASHKVGGSDALWVEQATSVTGTQNNFNLTGSRTTLFVSNASPVIFTGFTVAGVAPSAGDRVTIINIAISTVRVAHQDTGSTAAHRGIFPSTTGQILGAFGSMTLVYQGASSRWQLDVAEPGAPIVIAYAGGDFTGSGSMTVTVDGGDVQTFAYQQRGKIVSVMIWLNTVTVGGSVAGSIYVALPNSWVVTKSVAFGGVLKDNGTWGPMLIFVQATESRVTCAKGDLSSWTLSTNNSNLIGSATFEVD